jgi:peptidoglycan/xylan/chitin deacetylase (PgdA/CDA1 family)
MVFRGCSLIVLGWHNVEGTWCFPAAPRIGTRGLAQQLNALRQLANVVPLNWALQTLNDGELLPPRAVAITFDDGYRDNLTLAGPLLQKLGLPATCFLVPGILSREVSPWWEKLPWALLSTRKEYITWRQRRLFLRGAEHRYAAFREIAVELKRQDTTLREHTVSEIVDILDPPGEYCPERHFLDWDGARAIQNYMEIGSHSTHHSILARETPQRQLEDLRSSRQRLAVGLKTDVKLLAYPNGTVADYNSHTLFAAERAGYSYAITTERGRNIRSTPRYEIRRWVMNPYRGVLGLAKVVNDLAWQH